MLPLTLRSCPSGAPSDIVGARSGNAVETGRVQWPQLAETSDRAQAMCRVARSSFLRATRGREVSCGTTVGGRQLPTGRAPYYWRFVEPAPEKLLLASPTAVTLVPTSTSTDRTVLDQLGLVARVARADEGLRRPSLCRRGRAP
jgi:hypothetical protein